MNTFIAKHCIVQYTGMEKVYFSLIILFLSVYSCIHACVKIRDKLFVSVITNQFSFY